MAARNINRPRTYRVRDSPLFDVTFSDEEVRKRFRFHRSAINAICELVEGDLLRPTFPQHNALSVETQVLCGLRFFATGAMQTLVGDSIGISQASVSRSVWGFVGAINKLSVEMIQWPTGNIMEEQKAKFFDYGRFPSVIGLIDGCHIPIISPTINEQDYVNRKNQHSINVQLVSNANSVFTNAIVKWPGSTHDSFIFRNR